MALSSVMTSEGKDAGRDRDPPTRKPWGAEPPVRTFLKAPEDMEMCLCVATCVPRDVLVARVPSGLHVFSLPTLKEVLMREPLAQKLFVPGRTMNEVAFTDDDHPCPHLLLVHDHVHGLGSIDTDTGSRVPTMRGMERVSDLVGFSTKGPLLAGVGRLPEQPTVTLWQYVGDTWFPARAIWRRHWAAEFSRRALVHVCFSACGTKVMGHTGLDDPALVEVDLGTGQALRVVPLPEYSHGSVHIREPGATDARWVTFVPDESADGAPPMVVGDQVLIPVMDGDMPFNTVHVPGVGIFCSDLHDLVVWSHPDDVAEAWRTVV